MSAARDQVECWLARAASDEVELQEAIGDLDDYLDEIRVDKGGQPTTQDFFQPGHTYRHSAWTFRCDAVTSHPDTGERTVLGWFRFLNDTWRPLSCGEAEWAEGVWADITDLNTQ